MAETPSFRFIELFAGIGGFRIGLEAIGGECVWACELDQDARLTYKVNFGRTPYYDITKADLDTVPPFELLTAGFPCQDFSTLGEQKGLEGERGNLFFEIIRVLKHCKPPMLLLENVKGLTTMENGDVLKRCIKALEDEGYKISYKMINSLMLLPQFRNRVYIVGFKDPEISNRFRFFDELKLTPPRLVQDILQDLEEEPFLEHWKVTTLQWKNVKRSQTAMKYGIEKRLCLPTSMGADTLLSSYRNSVKSVAQFVAPEGYSEGVVGARPRWFTPRECARLMGFPDSYRLHPKEITACKQLGNAVCPPIISYVGSAILAARAASNATKNQIKEESVRAALRLVVSATGIVKQEKFMLKTVHIEGTEEKTVKEYL